MAKAAVRFRDPTGTMGGRGEIFWFNPGMDVPDAVAEVVDARCLVGGEEDSDDVVVAVGGLSDDALAEFGKASTMEEVAGWVTSAPDGEQLARAEYALGEERDGKDRDTLVAQLESFIEQAGD